MKSITEWTTLLREGKVSSQELVKTYRDEIAKTDGAINAFLSVNDGALARAKAEDERIRRGNAGRLAGIPVALKDMICAEGQPLTAASKMLQGYVAPYSATLVERLEAEGAVILGKNNQDEFAMGSSNETSCFGCTKNPWNTEYVPGGSSGGSAAAVAAGLVPASIGTDTGGSVRQPASFCGVVGVKPTYGRISRYGVIAYASSLDQAGPLALTVRDAALLCEAMSGWDGRDATSSRRPVPRWSECIDPDLEGKKIGVLKESFSAEVDPEVQAAVENSVRILRGLGADVEEISLRTFDYVVPTYYLIAMSEASSNLARYDGIRYGLRSDEARKNLSLETLYSATRAEGFGREVKRRILLGTHALSSGYYEAYYLKACRTRRLIQNEFLEAFKRFELLVSPVSATPAFRIGERIEDPLRMFLNDVFTVSANLAGLPAMSLPAGFGKKGLPIGLQLTAPAFAEQTLFDAGAALERELALPREVPHGVR